MDSAGERAAELTNAQRDIMCGHLVEIPPEDCDDLIERGLKGQDYWHEEANGRRLIWPITPLGLTVRAAIARGDHLPTKDQTNG